MERVARLNGYREPFAWWKKGIGQRVNNTSELAKERRLISAIRLARLRLVTAI